MRTDRRPDVSVAGLGRENYDLRRDLELLREALGRAEAERDRALADARKWRLVRDAFLKGMDAGQLERRVAEMAGAEAGLRIYRGE